MTLNKRAARNIKNNLAFYLISTILTVLVSMFLVAAISTGVTLKEVANDFLETYKTEDAEFTTYAPIPEDEIAQLEERYDIVLELSRYKEVALGNATLRIFSMPEKVNLFDVRDGQLPSDGEALITQKFANNHSIAAGDLIKTEQANFRISGFTTKSDYLYMIQNLGNGYRDNDTFGILIVNTADFEKIDAEETSYYSILYQEDNQKEVRKQIHEDYGISSYRSSSNNTRIYMPSSQGEEVLQMALLFAPIIFIIVIALIVMVLGRQIKSEQALLGTFLALGFRKKEITRHYMRFAMLPGIAGSVLGVILAFPVTGLFASLYIEYDFEVLTYQMSYNIPALVCALALPTLLYCLTVGLQSRKLLKQSPTELLRHTGKERRTIGILKNRRIKTAVKLRVRSIIGHPGRSIVTVFGACIAAICIITGYIMEDSLNDLLDHKIKDSVTYQYLYALNTLGEGSPEAGEGVLQIGYEVEGNAVGVNIVGIEANSAYYPQETTDGEKLEQDGYYMSSAAAEIYGIQAQDEFTFLSMIDLTQQSITIDGIVEDDAHSAVYTSRSNAAALAGLDGDCYNVIVSDQKLNLDKAIVASETEVTDTVETIRDLMGVMNAIVLIAKVLGALLCVGVLYLVINMIVQEGKTGISVMKVLGLSRREIVNRVLNVNHLLVLIGFVLAIPGAYAIVKIGFADTVENFGMQMYPVVSVRSVLFPFIILWLAYEASLLLQKRKIAGIDMVEALKENNRDE